MWKNFSFKQHTVPLFRQYCKIVKLLLFSIPKLYATCFYFCVFYIILTVYFMFFQKSSGLRRSKNFMNLNGTSDNKYRYKRKESSGSSSSEAPRRRIGCSVCSSELLNGEVGFVALS